MGYYKVLLKSTKYDDKEYCGLDRKEIFPWNEDKTEFLALWLRYVEYTDKTPGVTSEVSFEELHHLSKLISKETTDLYEVVYFSEGFACPHPAEYCGIEVLSNSGYSIGAENFIDITKGAFHPLKEEVINKFKPKLNKNYLFDDISVAKEFRAVVEDYVTDEKWNIYHIFRTFE